MVKTVGYTGWKIVSVTPADRLFQDFNRTEIMAVIIIIPVSYTHLAPTVPAAPQEVPVLTERITVTRKEVTMINFGLMI